MGATINANENLSDMTQKDIRYTDEIILNKVLFMLALVIFASLSDLSSGKFLLNIVGKMSDNSSTQITAYIKKDFFYI